MTIKPAYTSAQIPQIWDELRRKVGDVAPQLPKGAGPSSVGDDFGDVYGLLLAVTGDGYSLADIKRYATDLQKELSLVPGVARVAVWGVQDRRIYLDASLSQLTEPGISEANLERAVAQQNAVAAAGAVTLERERVPVTPSGQFPAPESVADLLVQASPVESLQRTGSTQRQGDLIRIGDFADLDLGYRDPPLTLMRYDGQPALALAITNQPGVNVVDLGKRVDARLSELVNGLPVGIEVHRVHWQSALIDEAVQGFFVSLLQAVLIVMAVLWLAMGWRMGVIIGSSIVLTILATFVVMAVLGIDLQRMSLGALIIALGMMVDNSIVVAEGAMVRMQEGSDRVRAAIEAAAKPAWPLLGATVIAVLAFYPIAASTENAGEYCASLFSVAGISLLLSWVFSVTVTPLQCVQLLRAAPAQAGDARGGRLISGFRGVLETAIRHRLPTLLTAAGLLVVAVLGFGEVTKLFFPDFLDAEVPARLPPARGRPDRRRGGGPERHREAAARRFPRRGGRELHRRRPAALLPAGRPRAAVAELRPAGDQRPRPSRRRRADDRARALGPRALPAGAGAAAAVRGRPRPDLEVRGPHLRPGAGTCRHAARARRQGRGHAAPEPAHRQRPDQLAAAACSSSSCSSTTPARAGPASPATMWCAASGSRSRAGRSASSTRRTKPCRSCSGSSRTRCRAPTSQRCAASRSGPWAAPRPCRSTRSSTASRSAGRTRSSGAAIASGRSRCRPTRSAASRCRPTMESLTPQFATLQQKLPPGYRLDWGGEYEASTQSQASLVPGIVPALGIMLIIIVGLFNALRPAAIIMLTIPFAVVGMTAGLLATGTPFGFVALLGAMSLAGMMVKNAIVLLDEVKSNLAAGRAPYDAVVEAALSRLRPVFLAAATTVLGVIPLLPDVFWVGLAVTIMAGLTIGTGFTMLVVPVLYATFYRIPARAPARLELPGPTDAAPIAAA